MNRGAKSSKVYLKDRPGRYMPPESAESKTLVQTQLQEEETLPHKETPKVEIPRLTLGEVCLPCLMINLTGSSFPSCSHFMKYKFTDAPDTKKKPRLQKGMQLKPMNKIGWGNGH